MRSQQPRSKRLERVSYIAMLTVMGEGSPASPFLSRPTVSMDPNVYPLGKPAELRSSAISCQHGNRRGGRPGMDLDLYPGFHVRLRGPHQLLLNLGGHHSFILMPRGFMHWCGVRALHLIAAILLTYQVTGYVHILRQTRPPPPFLCNTSCSHQIFIRCSVFLSFSFLLRKAAQYSTKYRTPKDHARRLALPV